MLFNSSIFILLFLPVVLGLYFAAASRPVGRRLALVAASLVFYGYWDPRFVPLLVGMTLINWWMSRLHEHDGRRMWLIGGIVVDLATLAFFKYTNFLVSSAVSVVGFSAPQFDIVLPLGISFFTFQMIAYLADLLRGEREHRSLLDFSLLVTFFPHLIAGPLVRNREIVPQFALDPRRDGMWEGLSRGAVLFVLGLFEKVALADTIAPTVDLVFAKAASGSVLNMAEAWAAAGGFSLQIYFDFAGYSNMAIGLALMFGLTFPINFNQPYRATSIREFWRRWHMTLSRFLRDYVYIPLGGNRRGRARQALNLMITMLLGGLWHGANWTFVAWGALHGGALALAAAWRRRAAPPPRFVGWLFTLLFVVTTFVLFRAADFSAAATVITAMTGANGIGSVAIDNRAVLFIAIAAALLLPPGHRIAGILLAPKTWQAVAAGACLVWLLLLSGGRLQKEFIYFQF
jgi:D-alanyl-lipoteichoic acid acyltransferase DltB (MBOAT superfamily)